MVFSFFAYIWPLIISAVMQIKMTMFLILMTASIFGQEIGRVNNGEHSVWLLKTENLFSWVYSDINSATAPTEKSFDFPNKETIYNIIMEGFDKKDNHQIIVQTDKDTVVKFQYKKIKGEMLLNINHHNLDNKTGGTSTSLSRQQMTALFGKQS